MAVQLLDKTLVMKPKRSTLVKTIESDDSVKQTTYNVYGEPREDRFDEIIDLLKKGNIYGDEKNISMGAVEVPIVKQIAIDKASTKGLKSEVFENTTESKLKKLRKLKRGY